MLHIQRPKSISGRVDKNHAINESLSRNILTATYDKKNQYRRSWWVLGVEKTIMMTTGEQFVSDRTAAAIIVT